MSAGVYGECRVTTLRDHAGGLIRLRIDQADPRVLIAAELLYEVFAAPAPGVSLDTSHVRQDRNGTPFWEGAILKICGENHQVVYRVGRYLPGRDCYEAEWPD